jgi:Xaa-Pro aminopeptidase
VHAAQTQYMTHDIPYEFRQNSNFLYLTGIEEPEGIAVFRKTAQENSYTLFVRPRNAHR